jgi:hypothetical protein
MKGADKRIELFNLYSHNWKLVRDKFTFVNKELSNEFEEAVLCPLCLNLYNRSTLTNEDTKNPLTLEHIPPEKLGGKPKILTCKQCNNKSGNKLDVALIEHLKMQPFFKLQDGAEVKLPKVTINHDDGKITSSATLRLEKKNTFFFKLNIRDKEEPRQKAFETLHTKKNIQTDFHFHSPNIKLVQIALLRIAYLKAYQRFGAIFIANAKYNSIREQIKNPEKEILPSFGVIHPEKVTIKEGMYVIQGPDKYKSLLVTFPITQKNDVQMFAVFLPSPFNDAVKYYSNFSTYQGGKSFSVSTNESYLDLDFLRDKVVSDSFLKPFED